MSLAEIAVTVTQLQNQVTKIQGKLIRLASSAKRNLAQTATALHEIAHHLEKINHKQPARTETTIIYSTLDHCRKQDKPDPLTLGDVCIQHRASGCSDAEMASRTGYTPRYIQQNMRLASLSEVRPYIENGHIAPDIADKLIQRYRMSDVIRIMQEAIAQPSSRKGRKITSKVINEIIQVRQFQAKRKR